MHGEVEKEPEIIPSVSVKTGCLQVTETENNWLKKNKIYFSHVKIWKQAVQGWHDISAPQSPQRPRSFQLVPLPSQRCGPHLVAQDGSYNSSLHVTILDRSPKEGATK